MNYLISQHNRPIRSPVGSKSAHRQYYTHIPRATQTATCRVCSTVEAVCLKKFKAHESSLTALLVEEDGPSVRRFISTGMDKTLCSWTLQTTIGEELSAEGPRLQRVKVDVAGGPVFSLQQGIKPKIVDPNTKQAKPVIYLGLAAKEIAAWQPDQLKFNDKVLMNGHTGYVRSLATSGKYLFSCGCNHLRQWDQAFAVPKEVSSTKLFKGDILAIACGDKRVFTAGADGVLRSWSIGKTGELTEAAVREKAHDGRITSIVVNGSLLYSAGYDGTIKAWDVSTLKLVLEVKAAHDGERVQTLVLGPSGTAQAAITSSNGTSSNGGSISSNGNSHSAPAARSTPKLPPASSVPASDGTLTSSGQDCASTDASDPSMAASNEFAMSADPSTLDVLGTANVSTTAPTAAAVGLAGSPSSSPSAVTILYSGGDDKMVRRWDARLLVSIGEPLQVHNAAVKALAVGDRDLLVSGDAAGEVAVWVV